MKTSGDKKLTAQSIFILALLSLSACSTSPEAEEGAAANGGESAAVAGSDAAAPKASTDSVPEDDHNPEIELAVAAGAVIVNPQDAALDANKSADAGAGGSAGSTASTSSPSDSSIPSAPTDSGSSMASAGGDVPSAPMADEPPTKGKKKRGKKPKAAASSVDMASIPEKSLAPGEGVAYTVKNGDTLMKIAFDQYGDIYRWKEIYSLNKGVISDPNHVPPGTKITIAGTGRAPASAHSGEQYLIKTGDTLGTISKTVYGTLDKWKKLWDNNKQLIRDPNKIYAGFYLYYLPEGKVSSTQEVEPSSTTPGV